MKKILVLVFACLIVFSFAGCGGGGGTDTFKVGMILTGSKDAPDMKAYAEMLKWAAEECDVDEDKVKIEYGVSEADDCTDEAKKLSKDGCDVIFVVTGGIHADCIEEAAEKCPTDVFVLIANEEEVTEKISLGNVKYAFVNKALDETPADDSVKDESQDIEVLSDAQATSDAGTIAEPESTSDAEAGSDAEVNSDSEASSDENSKSDKKSPYGKLGDYMKKVIADANARKTIADEWHESQV